MSAHTAALLILSPVVALVVALVILSNIPGVVIR